MRASTLMLLTWLKTTKNEELKAIIRAATDEQKIRKEKSHRREALFKDKSLLKKEKKPFLKQSQLIDAWLEQYSADTENPLNDEKRLKELASEWNSLVNNLNSPSDNVISEISCTDVQAQESVLGHVQGCLFGMLAGNWLDAITWEYPPDENTFSSLVWNIPFTWQPDDAIELALALANSLIKEKVFKPEAVYYAYLAWILSRPFKENRPIFTGIGENASTLLRTAILACFGRNCEVTQVTDWCALDVRMTHPDPVSVFANEVYAVAVLSALKAVPAKELYENVLEWGFKSKNREKHVLKALVEASTSPKSNSSPKIACFLQNAFYQLLHAQTITEGIFSGTEKSFSTEKAACGALLGAAYGEKAFPEKWKRNLLFSSSREKRPLDYSPHTVFTIAEKLVFQPE